MHSHLWDRLRAEDPDHSARYARRWRDLAAEGRDLDGEARFVGALAPPGATVLDAGSGTGRVGGYLAARGYRVAGVDLDEHLVAEARTAYPQAEWAVGDLVDFPLASLLPDVQSPETPVAQVPDAPDGVDAAEGGDASSGFDVIVSPGNVLTFIDPDGRRAAVANLAGALGAGGRLVTGFGAGRGYAFEEYDEDLAAAGLLVQHRFSTWDLRPFDPGSDFLVCVSGPAR